MTAMALVAVAVRAGRVGHVGHGEAFTGVGRTGGEGDKQDEQKGLANFHAADGASDRARGPVGRKKRFGAGPRSSRSGTDSDGGEGCTG